ncbi:MAG: hypothetical protein ACTSYS_13910 [Promethearchaeota archaeon]
MVDFSGIFDDSTTKVKKTPRAIKQKPSPARTSPTSRSKKPGNVTKVTRPANTGVTKVTRSRSCGNGALSHAEKALLQDSWELIKASNIKRYSKSRSKGMLQAIRTVDTLLKKILK